MWGLISWPNALILLGTILAAWANYKFTSKRKRLREQLVFIGIIISAAGGVWGSSQQETLEQQLFDITTGGDSFCYMTFSFPSDTLNTPHVAITLEGKYPAPQRSSNCAGLWSSRGCRCDAKGKRKHETNHIS